MPTHPYFTYLLLIPFSANFSIADILDAARCPHLEVAEDLDSPHEELVSPLMTSLPALGAAAGNAVRALN